MHGMVWYGLNRSIARAWQGAVCHAEAWNGRVRSGVVVQGMAWSYIEEIEYV